MSQSRLRWQDYVLERGDDAVDMVSAAAEASASTAFILGLGFDPRMLVGLRRIGPTLKSRLSVVAVDLSGTGAGQVADLHGARNRDELAQLVSSWGAELVTQVLPPTSDRRRSGLRLAQQLSRDLKADHIVVDISALPKSVYFPLIASWLRRVDERPQSLQLQVVVTENPALDDVIHGEGTLPPSHFGGFQHGLNLEAVPSGPRVWSPVLGPCAVTQLEVIHERLKPTEICPVLPFPARNPRRGDDLLIEHRKLLVDTFEVEASNYIYANEANPFDLYRTLSRLHLRYREALRPLGEATVVLSTHASKVLSIGVLLAAYEHALPVVTAGPAKHVVDSPEKFGELADADVLTCLWLHGEPYNI